MKVLHESHNELRLKNPLDLGLCLFMLIWGAGFIGMPMAALAIVSQQFGITTLHCDRPEPALVTCEHQQTGFFGLVERPTQSYRGVTGADLNTKTGTDDEGDTTYEHWVTIGTDQGEKTLLEAPIMINGVKGDPVQMGAIARQLSQFVESSQPSLTIQQGSSTGLGNVAFLCFMASMPLVALALLYFTIQSEELIFDREQGTLQRDRKTLLGKKQQVLPLHNITDAEIQAQRGKRTTYQLKLLPPSLKTKPLMSSQKREQVVKIERKVQQFLRNRPAYSGKIHSPLHKDRLRRPANSDKLCIT